MFFFVFREEFDVLGGPDYMWAYAHVLYPIQNVNLCCSIFMTLFLAMERYLAVSKPVEYYNR